LAILLCFFTAFSSLSKRLECLNLSSSLLILDYPLTVCISL